MFSIMVVEDDENTRKLMCTVLTRAGYSVCDACDGAEALELMDHRHIDLAVVDVMMPNINGYEFTHTLRAGKCDIPVLMVTANPSQQNKKEGFSAGTDDYMVKPVDEEEMLWRISALLRRSKTASEKELTVGSTVLDYNAFTVTSPEGKTILAPKEFMLLYKLLSNPRRLFTKRQIMDEIWDMDSETDEHTVEVHIGRLREKFSKSADFEIKTIRGFGYMGVYGGEINAD